METRTAGSLTDYWTVDTQLLTLLNRFSPPASQSQFDPYYGKVEISDEAKTISSHLYLPRVVDLLPTVLSPSFLPILPIPFLRALPAANIKQQKEKEVS